MLDIISMAWYVIRITDHNWSVHIFFYRNNIIIYTAIMYRTQSLFVSNGNRWWWVNASILISTHQTTALTINFYLSFCFAVIMRHSDGPTCHVAIICFKILNEGSHLDISRILDSANGYFLFRNIAEMKHLIGWWNIHFQQRLARNRLKFWNVDGPTINHP